MSEMNENNLSNAELTSSLEAKTSAEKHASDAAQDSAEKHASDTAQDSAEEHASDTAQDSSEGHAADAAQDSVEEHASDAAQDSAEERALIDTRTSDKAAALLQNEHAGDDLVAQHAAIQKMFGLDRPYDERSKAAIMPPNTSMLKTVFVLLGAVVVIALSIYGYYYASKLLDQKAQHEYELKKQREKAEEEARRNQTEYAEIAFFDSLPEQVTIALDGKKQYAKTEDGAYSELRAGKNTWIRYLPVKESTVLKFSFEAEGFRPLTRQIAYYDWFPAHSGDITLQKVFRKIVLEPDHSPKLPECEGDSCAWSVFREIVFRKQYAEMAAVGVIDEKDRDKNRERVLKTHPMLAASVGLDPAALPKTDQGLSPAAQNLLAYIDKHPYALYGSITIESDAPDTRVSFLGEPLMIVKESGSMTQVRVDPDKPVSFSTYGQGHPIIISEPLSIRLEANGYPAYVTELLPHQWHCDVPSKERVAEIEPPAFTQLEDVKQDFYHYVCDYSIKVSVNFHAIQEVDNMMNRNPEEPSKSDAASKDAHDSQDKAGAKE